MDDNGRRAPVCVVLLSLLLCSASVAAEQPGPVIAIIIDDLGYDLTGGERAAQLPGPVACSVLPHTPQSRRLAETCHTRGKEVLLHLPMQPVTDDDDPGPGVLTLYQDRSELLDQLSRDLMAVPHISGVNNHMGSLLTRHLAIMQWIMSALHKDGSLYFVDSYTTSSSVAARVARANGLPTARRDIFLDANPTRKAVSAELRRLKDEARIAGFALGIGHPHPSTLAVLERELPQLATDGIMLVSVAELIRFSAVEEEPWLGTYSYPSHTASKK